MLDSLVINCGRSVRDELSSPAWMKILLNSFVSNLPKKHIRNAIQQMFSNWCHLLQGELLGQEALNVCKHMKSKNYVVPPPMEYSPDAVRLSRCLHVHAHCVYTYMHTVLHQVEAVARGEPTDTFVQGIDFYSVAPISMPNKDSSASTSSREALRAATGPPTDAVEIKLVRMDNDRRRLVDATKACRDTAELLSQGATKELSRQAENRLARGQECAAQCRSWSDAVQVRHTDLCWLVVHAAMHADNYNRKWCTSASTKHHWGVRWRPMRCCVPPSMPGTLRAQR